MKKRDSLLLTFLVIVFIIGNYFFFFSSFGSNEKVVIARVLDGDTVELSDGRIVRFLNINTPERGERGYAQARDFLSTFQDKRVTLESAGREKYGRLLGRVYAPAYLNLEIVRSGLGHTLLVNDAEVNNFKKVQLEAFSRQQGIWERSPHYGCLTAEINKNKEFVVLRNACDVRVVGWTIKDESTHPYTFKKPLPHEAVLYSIHGKETDNERYWGRGKVWNSDRDSVFIRDNEGRLVYFSSYGY